MEIPIVDILEENYCNLTTFSSIKLYNNRLYLHPCPWYEPSFATVIENRYLVTSDDYRFSSLINALVIYLELGYEKWLPTIYTYIFLSIEKYGIDEFCYKFKKDHIVSDVYTHIELYEYHWVIYGNCNKLLTIDVIDRISHIQPINEESLIWAYINYSIIASNSPDIHENADSPDTIQPWSWDFTNQDSACLFIIKFIHLTY